MFHSVSYYFGAFGTVRLHYKTQCKTGQTDAKVRPTKWHQIFFSTNATDPLHWTPNSCFGVYCTIWMHLGAFRCCTKLGAKRAELVEKFVPRSRVVIFRNEHTGLTPLRPKLMLWCVSYYLDAFGTVWLPCESRCKMGRTSAKVRATKSHLNFSQRMHSIDPVGP